MCACVGPPLYAPKVAPIRPSEAQVVTPLRRWPTAAAAVVTAAVAAAA